MIRARKRFGQHFLEPVWVDKVIKAINPQPTQDFIEIGPGPGALTRPLAQRAKSVTAFEIDRDLAAALEAEAIVNVTVVQGDFLERDSSYFVPPTSYFRVAGNLPYNVASAIMFRLVELHAAGVPLVDATLMLQREVADRLVAGPGSKEYGVLSILIGHAADVDTVLKLPAGAFRPPPKVLSSLVRLRFREPRPAVKDPALFARIVQAVFTRRRKTMANALLALDAGLKPCATPEQPCATPEQPCATSEQPCATSEQPCATSEQPCATSEQPCPTPEQPGATLIRPAEALAAARIDGSRRPETLSIAEFATLADAYVLGR